MLTEQKRSDGKRSWVDEFGKVTVYDPEVCTPEHFEKETGIKVTSTIHVRKNIVKVGGNQYYKSSKWSGRYDTLCGAPVGQYDLKVQETGRKNFDPYWFERELGKTVCPECLKRAEEINVERVMNKGRNR